MRDLVCRACDRHVAAIAPERLLRGSLACLVVPRMVVLSLVPLATGALKRAEHRWRGNMRRMVPLQLSIREEGGRTFEFEEAEPSPSRFAVVATVASSANLFRHCATTFENDFRDNNYRLVVRDLKTTYGTSVEYDREAGRNHGGIRSDFRWIIGGHPVPEDVKAIVIELHDHLKFQIVVPKRDIASTLYIDNVTRFGQGVMSMDDLFVNGDIEVASGDVCSGKDRTTVDLPISGSVHAARSDRATTTAPNDTGALLCFASIQRGQFNVETVDRSPGPCQISTVRLRLGHATATFSLPRQTCAVRVGLRLPGLTEDTRINRYYTVSSR